MKNGMFLLLVLALFSCAKDNGESNTNKNIIGTWELSKAAGFAQTTTYPPGNGHIIIIGANGHFERRQNNAVVFSGNYTIRKKKDCHERSTDVILATNENNWNSDQYVEVENELLSLSTSNCLQDGGSSYYRKLE
jgi:hypothetical protein